LLSHREQRTPDNLRVTLEWQATGAVDRDYTAFVHLLDGAGKIAAQNDSQPGSGRFPTSLLPIHTAVEDMHVLNTAGLPAGSYQLEVGLYDAATGRRLSLNGSDADALTWSLRLGP